MDKWERVHLRQLRDSSFFIWGEAEAAGLLSLDKKDAQGDLNNVYKYLNRGWKDESRLFSDTGLGNLLLAGLLERESDQVALEICVNLSPVIIL